MDIAEFNSTNFCIVKNELTEHTSRGKNSGGRGTTVIAAFPLYIEYPIKTLGGNPPAKLKFNRI